MVFPNNYIRGVLNDTYTTEVGVVGAHLFFPNKRTSDQRGDGWDETSINWEDDENAIRFTLQTTKEDGTIKFQTGVVLLPREEIDRLSSRPTTTGLIGYERQQLPENPYHGNIVFRHGMDEHMMKRLAASIAVTASHIIKPE